MREWLIKRLGGYTEDEVLTTAVQDLYNTIGPEDILDEIDGRWVHKGKEVPAAIKKQIVSEAQFLLKTRLWKMLQDDIRCRANLKMFVRSKSPSDMVAGKLWLYTLDVLTTRLNDLNEGTGTFKRDA